MQTTSNHTRPSTAGRMGSENRQIKWPFSSGCKAPSSTTTNEHRSSHPRRKPLTSSDSSYTRHAAGRRFPAPIYAAASPDLTRHESWRYRLRHTSIFTGAAAMSRLITIALFSLLALTPVCAVRIKPTNCLPESFQNQNPPFIQWVPIEADAKFDTKSDKHNFQYIVWGNVKGSHQRVDLPKPDDGEYWTNPDRTNGKIINSDNSENGTTVKSSISMLTYVPWSHRSFFCSEALVNGTCPLPPVFNTTGNV